AQRAQGGEVVRAGAVTGAQRLLQEREVPGGRAGQGGAVAAEGGHQEGAQPRALPGRLRDRVGEAEAVLAVVGRGGGGASGEREGATEHAQLLRTERQTAAGSVWRGHAATIRANQTKHRIGDGVWRPCPPGWRCERPRAFCDAAGARGEL